MIENGMVDCIVQMPDKLFLTTGIPACLFILSKNRDGKDGLHRERKKEILFIDARKLGNMVNRRLRVFSDEDVSKVANAYHQWRNLPPSKGGERNDETRKALKGGASALEGSQRGVYPQQGGVRGGYTDIEGFCKAATLDEVKTNNNVLSPGRYVGTEAEEDDGISFEEKMKHLTQQLKTQFEESDKLEKQIKENLKSIGFEIK